MKTRYSLFSASLVVILMMTAAAKLISAGGAAHLLDLPDPLFALSNRTVMVLAAAVELALALSIMIRGWNMPTALASLWFGSILLVYRLALAIVAPSAPCPCLGTLTEQLHISARTAGMTLSAVLAYILIGSAVELARLYRLKTVTFDLGEGTVQA
jgi:hypothetical protein